MRVDDLHYELPPELIAQHPSEDRELARLMHLPAARGEPEHRRVRDLPDLLRPGTVVVVNDTRVIPARLLGRKQPTGGRVELFLVRRAAASENEKEETGSERRQGGISSPSLLSLPVSLSHAEVWQALGRSTKPLRVGTEVAIARRDDGPESAPVLFARVIEKTAGEARLLVALWTDAFATVEAAIAACGHVPLPPYIKRADDARDVERYQTVYARHDGAVAAPTAGLHLTESLIARIAARGCTLASVTLHVGLGTFQPVAVNDLDQHPMHSEHYVVGADAAGAIARAREAGAPVVAIGTTTARALETAADPERPGLVLPGSGETRILIQPGHGFRVVDGLFTNFHLPRSTLLAMVAALGGLDRVLGAYALAVRERYRFFSYGDAMLTWRRA
jgi:S-adenosylmethionine:tRNA ribosyltransferase-isomerase